MCFQTFEASEVYRGVMFEVRGFRGSVKKRFSLIFSALVHDDHV